MSEGLLTRSARRAQVGDHDLAIWRGDDGLVRAWQNRCPHRGMRLSFGFVRGDRLTCLYHGWTYNGQGSCVSIPAHPKLTPPKTITVGTYDCVEKAGLIWAVSKSAGAESPEIGGAWHGVRSLRIAASPSAVVEALRSAASGSSDDVSAVAGAVLVKDFGGGRSLLCAVQPLGRSESMLHLSIEGSEASAADRRAASEWAKRVRRIVEAETAAPVAAAA